MFKRKMLILLICFLFIITLSSVNANEDIAVGYEDSNNGIDDQLMLEDNVLNEDEDDPSDLSLGVDSLGSADSSDLSIDDEVHEDEGDDESDGEALSFDDLADEISNIEDGGVINLSKNYKYVSGPTDGIAINKSVTINGNNHTLDGNNQSRIFNNLGGTVILNNLIIINGFSDKGGAIFVNDLLVCNNVTFENNSADDGGAVYVQGNITLNDCIFDGNFAQKGAALYITLVSKTPDGGGDDGSDDGGDDGSDEGDDSSDDGGDDGSDDGGDDGSDDGGDDGSDEGDDDSDDEDEEDDEWPDEFFNYAIYNSVFKNSHNITKGLIFSNSYEWMKIVNSTFANSTSAYGAAATIQSTAILFNNTSFENLYASLSGGAIATLASAKMDFLNCSFTNVSSKNNGGAICADLNGENLDSDGWIRFVECKLINSRSNFGGAIAHFGGFLKIFNSLFENNSALYDGGAIYVAYAKSQINSSTFKNNKLNSSGHGGAIKAFGEELSINGSYFINNSFNALYCCDNQYEITNSFFNNNTQSIYSIYPVSGMLDGNNYTNDKLALNSTDEGYYVLIISSEGIQINPIKNDINVQNLPSRYDSKDWGWVTPVKDQGITGTCWVFGTCAALEASILKSIGVEYNISISNLHHNLLKYSKYGHSLFTESGMAHVAAEYILSWYGAVPEEYAPFDMYGKFAMPLIISDAFHVQDMLWLSGRANATDNDEIKKAIMKYGAVTGGVDMHNDPPYFNKNTSALYVFEGEPKSGHVVCIVGWDDNYPASNFYNTPPGNGAWIVKNSYGTSNYDEGYIYVSYYDKVIGYEEGNVAFIFENTENYNKNYQTDIGGEIIFVNDSNGYVYKNTYTAIDADFISAVGTYFISLGEKYSLEIYVNGKLKHSQSGKAPFKGFHTVKLTKGIPIKKGDTFTVLMKKSSVPLLNDTQQHFKKGMSMIYVNGSWKDLSLGNNTASLKVYTKPLKNLKTTIVAANVNTVYNGGKYLTVTVKDVYGDVLKGVKVTIKLSNGVKKTFVTNSKGQIKFLTNNLAPKTYSVTISTLAFGKYLETSSSAKIIVKKAKAKIKAKSRSFKAKTKIKKVKVTLKNSKNKAIKKVKITIKIKGKTYSAKTNKKGLAVIKIKKLTKKGKYKAVVRFAGNKYYNKASKKITIKIK